MMYGSAMLLRRTAYDIHYSNTSNGLDILYSELPKKKLHSAAK